MAAVSCIVYMYHNLFIQLKLENLKAQLVLSARGIPFYSISEGY